MTVSASDWSILMLLVDVPMLDSRRWSRTQRAAGQPMRRRFVVLQYIDYPKDLDSERMP
jgi:hypothetical protein